ncbi:hypothetical protein ASPZODRAFT_70412 [Penicilliopsis zonata CBS 506.65]|uniref:Lariat debranching enzyme C-terminal domain-containing protein n=1 Tax=Penicilliopsis zonata CBS 506.65 TaxID=1073090 RepID=A0A1L9SCM8_9EURO|nr:hypothetical protein ASPZODRAFT_70412 [Penicilliopsis zonata CBS 506.65]OJJ44931.1 hypothetical protein ASPZODRAFT_70412 [Penicilliopsis zonata CBS 506.65]
MEITKMEQRSLRVALEGCGHGCLHDIYASVEKSAELKGWDGVDLVIIGGDFQAVRNSYDLACMSVPHKYKEIGDFHEYYSGKRTAPYLTIFVGGNHEASNYLFELYYGGWVAPNIYYLGAANVIRVGPLRIAGMSGIWKGYDYRKPHYERLPYNQDEIQSIYHVRELDVRKLLQIRTQVDVGISHDWPKAVELSGDYEALFRKKRGFREDSQNGRLGNPAAKYVLDRLRPSYWFSAHLHVKFAAQIHHGAYLLPESRGMKRTILQRSPQVKSEREEEQGIVSRIDQNARIAANGTLESQGGPRHSMPTDTQSKLSAWNNFHQVAAKNEAAENARLLEEYERGSKGGLQTSQVVHNLTWKKIDTGDDGFGRKVSVIEKSTDTGSPESKKLKVEPEDFSVKNADEIDLDLDSDDEAPTAPAASATKPTTPEKPTAVEVSDTKANGSERAPGATTTDQRGNAYVSQDIRNQLPESFSRPTPDLKQEDEPVINEPLPEAISNTTTCFLALDKCVANREFLQLTEFEAISVQEDGQVDRPFRLQYDKEWLAITRVFANDLQLADPAARPSSDKGDAIYKPQIIEAEQWVEENIVKAEKLDIPENFIPTAPYYDPAVPITTQEMPIEYNNPQTAQFCELLGITNKFHLTDEERQARIDAGPRAAESRGSFGRNNRFPRRGGHGGGRGHRNVSGRGRDRGGFRY